MKARKLIYGFSVLAFFPIATFFIFSMLFTLGAVFRDLLRGHPESLILLLPIIGGNIGLVSALLTTCDIAGNSISKIKALYKRLGLILGVVTELSIIAWITPNIEPFLYYWLPPIVAAIVLFILSFKHSAIGIGSDLTATPSHTTRHTDRVPRRFG